MTLLLTRAMFLAAMIVSCLVPPLFAQSTQPTTQAASAQRFAQLLADLDQPDASMREAARFELLGMTRSELDAFRDAVSDAVPLQPAQHAALREIVRHVFLSGEPYDALNEGFIGVMLDPVNTSAGLVVVDRVPGFVGFQVLQNDDIILAIAEHPETKLQSVAALTDTVKREMPGRTLHLQVLRRGLLINVPVRLGARPYLQAEVDIFQFRMQREEKADAYWERFFEPFVQGRTSA